jgi:hypothetical protein
VAEQTSSLVSWIIGCGGIDGQGFGTNLPKPNSRALISCGESLPRILDRQDFPGGISGSRADLELIERVLQGYPVEALQVSFTIRFLQETLWAEFLSSSFLCYFFTANERHAAAKERSITAGERAKMGLCTLECTVTARVYWIRIWTNNLSKAAVAPDRPDRAVSQPEQCRYSPN